jgi:hypothetical protein
MLRVFILVLFFPVLQACSNLGGAVVSAAKAYYEGKNPPSYANIPLKPNVTYLEVRTNTNSALMVLGSLNPAPQGKGQVETWFSASNEILRTSAGFVVGSEGVPQLPQLNTLGFNSQGEITSMVVNYPQAGIHELPLTLLPRSPELIKLKNSNLLGRARQVNGLVLRAWRMQANSSSPKVQPFNSGLQVVGTHPQTGHLVYGLYCPEKGQCIEYLLRTAAQNL